MKQRCPFILTLLVCVSTTLFADSYWVAFTDKKGLSATSTTPKHSCPKGLLNAGQSKTLPSTP